MTKAGTITGGGDKRSSAFRFILIVILLDMCAVGLIAPALPGLVRELLGGTSPEAASYLGWFTSIFAVMQFLFAPVLGALSDRFGRRPVLLLSMITMGLEYALMALAPSVVWLCVGRMLTGISSSNIATASAYVADITAPEDRAAKFGLVGATFALGYMMGPAIGGLLGQIDLRLPLWTACALGLGNALYGYIVLPESLPKPRPPLNLKMANPAGILLMYRSLPGLKGLACILLLYFLVIPIIWTLWAPYTEFRFGWSTTAIGLSLTVIGLAGAVVQAKVVRSVVARWSEWAAVYLGLTAGVIGFTLFGLAPVSLVFVLGIPLYGLMGMIGSGIQGLMSKKVSPAEQGRLQGANSALMAVGSMTGPVLFTQAFKYSASDWSSWAPTGTPFLLAALLLLMTLIFALLISRKSEGAAAMASPVKKFAGITPENENPA